MALPIISVPAIFTAASVASVSANSIWPNPLKSPVSRSVANRTCETVPQSLKASRNVSSSMSHDKFPIKTVTHPSCFSEASRPAKIGLGVEYLMDNHRPSKSEPFSSIAAAASSEPWNARMAVPEERPSLCKGNSTDLGPFPHCWKNDWTSSSVALQGRPRMYNLVMSSPSSPATACFLWGVSTDSSGFRFLEAFSSFSSLGRSDSFVASSSSLSESEESEESEESSSLSTSILSLFFLAFFLFSFSSSLSSESEESEDSSFLAAFSFLAGLAFSSSSSLSESESELESEEDSSFLAVSALTGLAFSSSSESEESEDSSFLTASTFLGSSFFAGTSSSESLSDEESESEDSAFLEAFLVLTGSSSLLLLLEEEEELSLSLSSAAAAAASAALRAASSAAFLASSAAFFLAAFLRDFCKTQL